MNEMRTKHLGVVGCVQPDFHQFRRRSLTALATLVLIAGCSATTVVVIRTPEHVVVASDSLVVTWHARSASTYLYHCKLYRQNQTFFVVEGIGVAYGPTRFSVEDLARSAIQASTSMQEAAAKLARTMTSPYAVVMQRMRTESPPLWDLVKKSKRPVISLVVVLFGNEEGAPKYVVVSLQVIPGKKIKVAGDSASCPGDACEEGRENKYWLVLGEREAIYQAIGGSALKSFSNFQGKRTDSEMAKVLVQIEEQSAWQTVGGPIDIVSVDSSGPHWTTPAGRCE